MKLLFFLLTLGLTAMGQRNLKADVLVIGGGTGGIAAGLQSARLGSTTIIVEPTTMLGGMLTAAGVSCTDGNDQLPSGLWEEFRQGLYKHYKRNKLNSGWVSATCFEPRVGDSVFKAMASIEKNLEVIYGFYFDKPVMKNERITGAEFTNAKKERLIIAAKIVVDATELGDVFDAAGNPYDVGMDDPKISGEKQARQKNKIIQDLTWAAVLKDYGAGANKTIARPAGYDSTKYFCTTSDAPCNAKPYDGDKHKMLSYGKLPNGKYMLNWPPYGNDIYLNVVEMKPLQRQRAYQAAIDHTLGFIYFMQTTLGMKHIGLAEDELNKGLAWIPYNREGRRVHGMVRFNINHILRPFEFPLYQTGISVGDYPVDHHHGRYPGAVPPIEFPSIPSYNIPLGSLIPSKVKGLVVADKGISVTNIVNGTTRLQPVVLLTGQAAGVLASLGAKEGKDPAQIPVRKVQEILLSVKAFIMPYVDVPVNAPDWLAIQRVGASGVMRGQGASGGWANKTFFYPDSLLKESHLISKYATKMKTITFETFNEFLWKEIEFRSSSVMPGKKNRFDEEYRKYLADNKKNPLSNVTRREAAVIIDHFIRPFDAVVGLDGAKK